MRTWLALFLAVFCVLPASAQQQAPRMQVITVGPVAFQAPPHWTTETQGPGAVVVSDPNLRGWALEIGADAIDISPQRATPEQVTRLAESTIQRELAAHQGNIRVQIVGAGEQVVVHDYAVTGANPVRVRAWHRIALRGNGFVLAGFIFRTVTSMADRPEYVAARDVAERQALSAVLRPQGPH
jgi:hypothetical protein